jgi:hypothetical protein
MSKKRKKDKRPRRPKVNSQIPISKVRKFSLKTPQEILKNARKYPILGCWTMQGWQESGIAPFIIARQQDEGQVLFANYMVDLYCLGIKDVLVETNYARKRFERSLPKFCMQQPEEISVELAHEIIYGALEFARKYGFEPHPDFTRLNADQVLDPPEAYPRTHKVEFGQDGKPLFISGPYDDERKIQRILQTLERNAGEGNFHYVIGFDDAGFIEE